MRHNISSFAALIIAFALAYALPSVVGADEASSIPHGTLARLVRACAPQVDSTTQAAIIAVESGGSPWLLHDDNDGRIYAPQSRQQAEAAVNALVTRDREFYGVRDRGIDVGLAQINTTNLSMLGLHAADLLEPCANLNASARILVDAYVRERAVLAKDAGWHGDEVALRHALQVYNSGRPEGDDGYVRAVYATLDGSLVREVGSGVRVAPIPVIPLRVVTMAPLTKKITSPRSSAFYQQGKASGDSATSAGMMTQSHRRNQIVFRTFPKLGEDVMRR